jgi:hypothetical protein
MVVGAEIMMRIFLLLLLTGCSSVSVSGPVKIFGAEITLNNSCAIEYSSSHKNSSYALPFKGAGDCRLVTHQHTNIPNIQYVNGMYLMFIENNINEGDKCRSEYTAIGVNNAGALLFSKKIKRSSSCFQSKENVSFEYFSNFMDSR